MENRRNIAVFGASGFIGGNIVRYFKHRPEYRVFSFSSSSADLTKTRDLKIIFSKLKEAPKPTLIIAAAAFNKPPLTPRQVLRANRAIALNSAKLIARLKCAQVIFLSSIDVYGHNGLTLPLSESSPTKPPDAYAASKLFSERILTRACATKKTPLVILRLPGVYGPGDKSGRIIPSIFKALKTEGELTIAGNGKQCRDLLHVKDIARLAGRIISHPLSGTFNAVTGKSYSLNEIIRMAGKITVKKLKIIYQRGGQKQYDIHFKPSLVMKHLRAFSFTPLPKGLRLAARAILIKCPGQNSLDVDFKHYSDF